ncbi:MAG: carbon-nitrogen hydrolase [Candidatus Aenigmarchaeota archaeon ex4484_52]|nr:MAG: carbon-nitrogen hydrolase [Candidatus Aenigmarchaeota archaeon ex4484_52]
MKISLVQLEIVKKEKERNFSKISKLIKKINSDVILFPEFFATGYLGKDSKKYAEKIGGKSSVFLKNIAKEKNANVIAGIIEKEKNKCKNKIRNVALVYDKKARLKASYSKIHLFSLADEQKYFNAGNALSVFDINGIKCSVLICYDLRFPEIFRKLADKNVKLIFLMANWPDSREEHWLTLIKARAIENQIFIAAANMVGKIEDKNYFGSSVVVDPWGNFVKKAKKNKEEIITTDIDLNEVDKIRNKFNVFKDRKTKLYNEL